MSRNNNRRLAAVLVRRRWWVLTAVVVAVLAYDLTAMVLGIGFAGSLLMVGRAKP
jgi:hypothetical protein